MIMLCLFSVLTFILCHLKLTSSTSKIKVAFGGITPPAPEGPYARFAGITSVALAPFFSNEIPFLGRQRPSMKKQLRKAILDHQGRLCTETSLTGLHT